MISKKVLALSGCLLVSQSALIASAPHVHESLKSHSKSVQLEGYYSPGYLKLRDQTFAVTKSSDRQQLVYTVQPYAYSSGSSQFRLIKLAESPSVSGGLFTEYLATSRSGKHSVMIQQTPPSSTFSHHSLQQSPTSLNIKKSITASGSVVLTTMRPDGSAVRISISPSTSGHNKTVTKSEAGKSKNNVVVQALAVTGTVVVIGIMIRIMKSMRGYSADHRKSAATDKLRRYRNTRDPEETALLEHWTQSIELPRSHYSEELSELYPIESTTGDHLLPANVEVLSATIPDQPTDENSETETSLLEAALIIHGVDNTFSPGNVIIKQAIAH